MTRIVTFYSYKGGTGRTMLLANVAWILAANGQRVLLIDWDLEAPGLHRYLAPFLDDAELEHSEGLIEMFREFAAAKMTPATNASPNSPSPPPDSSFDLGLADVTRYAQPIDYEFPEPGEVHLLCAGRQDESYAAKVNTFDWQAFYDRLDGAEFIDAMKASMTHYDWVLVDSRTGVSDTAGICTLELPQDLVICFTYNNQSIEGAAAIADSVRRQKPAHRVFPIPTRVEDGEALKLTAARKFSQSRFFDAVAWMGQKEAASYWATVEVPYRKLYAYEEMLAALADEHVSGSVLQSCEWLVGRLTKGAITAMIPIKDAERRSWIEEFAVKRNASVAAPEKVSFDVFICTSQRGMRLASEVKRELERAGLRIAGDVAVDASADFRTALSEAVRRSRHFVLFVDHDLSSLQRKELSTYLEVLKTDDMKRLVIPVLVPGSDLVQLPPSIRGYQSLVSDNVREIAQRIIDVTSGRSQPTERKPRRWLVASVLTSGVALAAAGLATILSNQRESKPQPIEDAGLVHEDPAARYLKVASTITTDPLLRAMILREIPVDAFPSSAVRSLLGDVALPVAFYPGTYRDARFNRLDDRLVLTYQDGFKIVPVDGRGAVESHVAKGITSAFFTGLDDTLVVLDSTGALLWEHEATAGVHVEFPGSPRAFVASTRSRTTDTFFLAAGSGGVNGTQDAIYQVNLKAAQGHRWLDSKLPVQAMSFENERLYYITRSGWFSSLAAVDKPITIENAPAVKLLPGANVIAAADGWLAWAAVDAKQLLTWHVGTKSPTRLDTYPEKISALAVNQQRFALAQGNQVAVSSLDNPDGSSTKMSSPVTALALGDSTIAIGTDAGNVEVRDLANNFATLLGAKLWKTQVAKVGLSADGEHIYAIDTDGEVYVFAVRGKRISEIIDSELYAYLRGIAICLSPSERTKFLGETTEAGQAGAATCKAANIATAP